MSRQVNNTSAPPGDKSGYLARPAAETSWSGRWGAAATATVLVAEMNRRLTALAVAVNLVMSLQATSADVVADFMSASCVLMLCLPVGGCGFLAGSFLRRYLTVSIFVVIQTSGVAMLTFSTAAWMLRPPATCASVAQLVLVFLTALGTGGLNSSVSGFGSEQFDETGRGEKMPQMPRFFNRFFFFISLCSMLAVSVLVYVQDTLSRPWGRAAAIAAALVVFLADTHSMIRFKKMVRSPLTHLAAAAAAAWPNRRVGLPADLSMICHIDISMVAFAEEEEGPTNKGMANQHLPHNEPVMATGFAVSLFAVAIGVGFGGYGLVLTLLGILTGVAFITVGVQMSFCTTTIPTISLLAVRLRRNLAVVGLVVASTAITAITGESSPGICFDLFASLLVGIALIIAGVLGA